MEKQKPESITNFLTVVNCGSANIEKAYTYLLEKYDIHRLVGFHISKPNIDNTGGEYAYDDNFERLKANLEKLDTDEELGNAEQFLCQFTTDKPLTEEDLLAIPDLDNDERNLMIMNRWHAKNADPHPGLIPIVQRPIDYAGIISIICGELSFKKNHEAFQYFTCYEDSLIGFCESYGIEACANCPVCGDRDTVTAIKFDNCPKCKDRRFKRFLFGSLNKAGIDFKPDETN